jgi:HAMP domain-containing protein
MTLRQVRNYIIVFGVVVLCLVGFNYYSNTTLTETLSITIELTDLQEVVQSVETIRDAMEEERIAIGQYPLTGNEDLLTRMDNAQASYDEAWSVIATNRAETMSAQISEIEAVRETYKSMLDEIISVYQANPTNNTASAKLSTAINFFLQNLDPKISSLAEPEIAKLQKRVAIEKERSDDLARITQIGTFVGIFLSSAALVMAGLAVYGTQRMVTSIDKIVDAANAISRGDLDIPIDVDQRGEIGEMASAIERMRTSLKAAIERLRR